MEVDLIQFTLCFLGKQIERLTNFIRDGADAFGIVVREHDHARKLINAVVIEIEASLTVANMCQERSPCDKCR